MIVVKESLAVKRRNFRFHFRAVRVSRDTPPYVPFIVIDKTFARLFHSSPVSDQSLNKKRHL